VPYRGSGPAITDLIGGRVQVLFTTTSASMPFIKSGQVRALAVGTATKVEALPDLPLVSDVVPGFEASNFYGVGAPRATPADIIARLNKEIALILADPKMKTRLAELGATTMPLSPEDFRKLVADETEKWAKVVKFSGARPD
jgi:tripartite-type tricarboxylate transporter receptor subunit TctC